MSKEQILDTAYEPWPALPYEDFKETAYLLHMATQAAGKLKLATPFEPHWGNVALWITSRGLTTGPIPYSTGTYSLELDLIAHQIVCTTSWGRIGNIDLFPISVAELIKNLFDLLKSCDVNVSINMKPQEVSNPIPFDQDTQQHSYDASLANAWWRILISSHRVLQRYHARFYGETPSVGFMWGTFDLRDARYINKKIPTTGINADYIRRNAMDEAQIEVGWFSGNDAYPHPAYFSFTFPQPDGIENAKIEPVSARWEKSMSEFVLDYENIRTAHDPEKDLLAFFESTYKAGADLAGWSTDLLGPGKPI